MFVQVSEDAPGPEPFRISMEALLLDLGAVPADRDRPRLSGPPVTDERSPRPFREDVEEEQFPLVHGDVVWPAETDRLLYPFARHPTAART